MSLHNSPHLLNKRTPDASNNNGTSNYGLKSTSNSNSSSNLSKIGFNNANVSSNEPKSDHPVDKSKIVSDYHAINAKQLLNTYIYDFLLKSRLPNTAKIFVNEAEIPINNESSGINSPGTSHLNTSQPNTPTHQLQLENNLPQLAISMDSPQGFLYEWWQIFWDVFQARNSNGPVNNGPSNNGSVAAQNKSLAFQYYQLKQRQQQDSPGSNMNMPNFAQFNPNPNQLQLSMQQQHFQQQQQQQNTPQLQPQLQPNAQPQPQQMGHPHQHPSQQVPMNVAPNINRPGSFNVPPGLDPQQQQRYVMQMIMKQQQQQQQQQHPGQPPIGQQIQGMTGDSQLPMNMAVGNNMNMQQQMYFNQQQNPQQAQLPQQRVQQQMNNLRQQAAVQAQQAQVQNQQLQQHSQQQSPSSGPGVVPPGQLNQIPSGAQVKSNEGSSNNSPATSQRLNQMNQFNQPINMNNGPQQFPQQIGVVQNQALNNMRMNSMSGKPNQNNAVMYNGNLKEPGSKNMNALQDYQMQLMLLEKQNKKRLDIARNNGNGDASIGMLPSNQQAQQPGAPQQVQTQQLGSISGMAQSPLNIQKPSPQTASNSPVITNKPSPSINNGKKKKEPASKRSRKSSATGSSISANQNGTQNTTTPSLLKKDYTTPLTPASEPAADPNKRKRKNSATGESPKKQNNNTNKYRTSSNSKIEKPISENPETKEDTLAPPSSTFNEHASKDQIFNVDILGSTTSETHSYFGASATEIDFDFNQFLDGNADSTLGDGINGFNWGNVDAIENGE